MPPASDLPGSGGLPLLGETPSFLSDPEHFLATRLQAHGPLFRTHLLTHPTMICADYPHSLSLLLSDDLDSPPAYAPFLTPVYPRPNLLTAPSTHASARAHRRMRAALSASRLPDYQSCMFRAVDTSIDAVIRTVTAAGSAGARLRPYAVFKQVAERGVTALVLGDVDDARYERLRRLCSDHVNGVAALPVKAWALGRGTARARGEAGYEGVREIARDVLRERKGRPEVEVRCVVDWLRAQGEDEDEVAEFAVMLLSGVVAKSVASLAAEAAKAVWRARDAGNGQTEAEPDLDCVLMECARLYPPIMGGMRGGGGLACGVALEEGWRAWYSIRHANRDARVYGSGGGGAEFRWERWRGAARRDAARSGACPFARPDEPGGAQTPLSFGAGERHCPGRDAAWWIARRAVDRLTRAAAAMGAKVAPAARRREKLFPVLRDLDEAEVVLVERAAV